MNSRKLNYEQKNGLKHYYFFAMGSPCELISHESSLTKAENLAKHISQEVYRLEDKYSRYIENNLVHKINKSDAKPVNIDTETYRLLEFASQCFDISDGYFDITSGVLRKAWQFSGNKRIASKEALEQLLPLIGWNKIKWNKHSICLPKGMEIDFGGIVKEYAVDRCAQIASEQSHHPFLINLGGDLFASPKTDNSTWQIGIEHPSNTETSINHLELRHGALTTSGDVRRFIEENGKRYGHILNPKTGWPISEAPRSITVHAAKCIDAGILSTLAMLQGNDAERFLDAQQVKYWCYR